MKTWLYFRWRCGHRGIERRDEGLFPQHVGVGVCSGCIRSSPPHRLAPVRTRTPDQPPGLWITELCQQCWHISTVTGANLLLKCMNMQKGNEYTSASINMLMHIWICNQYANASIDMQMQQLQIFQGICIYEYANVSLNMQMHQWICKCIVECASMCDHLLICSKASDV